MIGVILAGGKGSRLGSLTKVTPKPMIKVGGKPILWHILKILSSQGIKEFIICLGYKGNIIKNYISKEKFDFNVKCVSTGENTLTARRIFLIKNEIKSERFLMTYGDGVSNINISKLLKLHKKKKKLLL